MPEYVYALFDFVPENPDEIQFKAGDRIEVEEKDDVYSDGWWQVSPLRSAQQSRPLGLRPWRTHIHGGMRVPDVRAWGVFRLVPPLPRPADMCVCGEAYHLSPLFGPPLSHSSAFRSTRGAHSFSQQGSDSN